MEKKQSEDKMFWKLMLELGLLDKNLVTQELREICNIE